jgi:hypothetical protein
MVKNNPSFLYSYLTKLNRVNPIDKIVIYPFGLPTMNEADEIAENYSLSELHGVTNMESARRKARLIMSCDESEQMIDNVAEALLHRKRSLQRQRDRQ